MLHFLLFLIDPQSAADLLRKGLTELQSGQVEQAQTDLKRAADLDPSNAYIWSSLAETHWQLKEHEAAFAAAAKAEQAGAHDPVVSHALAIFYTQVERPDKAAPLEQKFAESAKSDPDAFDRAAGLYLNAKDAQRAIDLGRKAIARHDTASAENTLGRALVAAGRNDEAMPHLKKAWELSEKPDSQIAFDYAQALLQKQLFTEAAEVAARALQSLPSDAQLQLVLGVARYGQRRFEEAITAFLKVVELDPTIPQPYLFLSNLLEQAGPHLDQIIAVDEAWAAREPQNAKAQLTLAKALLLKDRKSERAKSLLERSIALDDQDWHSHYELGVLLENARNYKESANHLLRSIALNAKQPLPHYHLARVYDRLGQPDDAKREREIHAKLTGMGER